jgi:hypothetical protein
VKSRSTLWSGRSASAPRKSPARSSTPSPRWKLCRNVAASASASARAQAFGLALPVVAPEPVLDEAAAGFLTSPGARLLLIGNPTRTSGEFFNARAFYNCIAIPAESTPAFTGENVPAQVAAKLVGRTWVEDHRRKWGEQSPLYQVRIGAEFPSQSDDVVVALGDLEAAQQRELEPGWPLIVACDVARFGSDNTVIAIRRGNVVRIAKSYGGRDTMRNVGELTRETPLPSWWNRT